MIIQEKLAQEKVEEPSTTGAAASAGTSGAAATSGAATTGTTPAPPTGTTVAAPSEPSGSSAAARRLAPDRTGAESDADLVNSQHLQVWERTYSCVVRVILILTPSFISGSNGHGIPSRSMRRSIALYHIP